MRRGLRISLGAVGGLVLLSGALGAGVLGSVDGRRHVGEFVLSHALHREVRLRTLNANLLTARPSFHAEGVVVTSPRNITQADLLHARALDAEMDWLGLFGGQTAFRRLSLDRPELHLVRLGHERNNYTFGAGGGGSALRRVQSLAARDGHLIYEDPERHLSLDGVFSHDGRGGPQSLHMRGSGVAGGQSFTATAVGGQLNGRAPADAYPFSAHMLDGKTDLAFTGVTQKPFDFRGFDFAVQARGPNLADLHYLFGVDPLNSPPFEVVGHVHKADHLAHFTDLVGRVGGSDLKGQITGDDRGPRRKISARLTAGTLQLGDVGVLLTRAPDHAAARSEAGHGERGSKSGPLSDKPFSVKDLRAKDLDLELQARSVVGAPFAISDASTRIQLTSGLLVISPLLLHLGAAPVSARVQLDARGGVPRAALAVTLHQIRLAQVRRDLTRTVDGDLTGRVVLAGAGASPLELAAHASGYAAVALVNGRLAAAPANALGGDLFKSLAARVAGGGKSVNLQCAGGRMPIRDGVVSAEGLRIFTDVGETDAHGTISPAKGQLALRLDPSARPGDLAQVAAPITITGPLAKPKVSAAIGPTLKRNGLGAVVKLAASPLAGLASKKVQSYADECARMAAEVR